METTSTSVNVPIGYRLSAALFLLLFNAFFPAMILLGLSSPIFWGMALTLWGCAAMHGRLDKQQSSVIRHALRPLAWACVMSFLFIAIRIAVMRVWLGPEIMQYQYTSLACTFLGGFCAITALVSSYKQNPS